jgi:serine protease Do
MLKQKLIVGAIAAICSVAAPGAYAQRERSEILVGFTGSRSFLGVGVAEISSERASALNLKEERGVEITRVEEDSPAAKAGLKVQDVVLEYNGHRVEGTEQFVRLVRETPQGRTARLLVSRGGQTQTITASIGTRSGPAAETGFSMLLPELGQLRTQMEQLRTFEVPAIAMNWRNPVLGIEAEALKSQLAGFFGVTEGVLVRSVSSGSAAEKAGVKAGDVITHVDGTKVATPTEITRALRSLGEKKSFPLTVMRDKKETQLSVERELNGPRSLPRGRSVQYQEFEL